MSEPPRMQRTGRPPTARLPSPQPQLSAREAAEVGPDGIGLDNNERMVRRRRRVEDKFFIDRRKIPEGFTYEWKRVKVYGQPDIDHQVNLRENMWSPVMAERHPEMMPTNHKGAIEKDGMVLMERPHYLTEEAREEDYNIAMDQVRVKEQQLGNTPSGTFTRDHPSVRNWSRVRRSYGPIDAEG